MEAFFVDILFVCFDPNNIKHYVLKMTIKSSPKFPKPLELNGIRLL